MLRWIRIQDVAVIDTLEVDFAPGLNLLTGETGAGKSILIDALGLILGGRASSELVRTGAPKAIVEAGFELVAPPLELVERLSSAGIELEDELVVRREVGAGGRGKVVVNGNAAAASLLRDIAPYLADVHGQGEHYSLVRPDAGLQLLDDFAGVGALVENVGEELSGLRATEREITLLEKTASEATERRERLEFELRELDTVDVQPGEDVTLREEREVLANAEKLAALADGAYRSLYESDAAALSQLASVWKQVEELSSIDSRLTPYLESRGPVQGALEDLALFLRDYRGEVDVSPGRLEAVEERLSAIERLKKKYGGSIEAVSEHRESCRQGLASTESLGEQLESERRELAERRTRFLSSARELSGKRRRAARRLQKKVSVEFPSLALEKARFYIELSMLDEDAPSSDWTATGLDRAEFQFSANPGEELRALSRTASGGELSRFMLALKSVVAKAEPGKTLVFDEVDAGIGGRVANAVGEKLGELARGHQVICVTHLPQIASFAPAHYRVDKVQSQGRTFTRVVRLDTEERIDEIARMLAGAAVTKSARQHAEQLLADNLRRTRVEVNSHQL